jgi:hypothetical protein
MEEIKEKINSILSLYEEDKEKFTGYSATERLLNNAPEDYVESRTDWNTLKAHADEMYYMLSYIEDLITECKELL